MATKSRLSQALPIIVGAAIAICGIAFGLSSGGSASTAPTYLSQAVAVGSVVRTAAGDGTIVAEKIVGLSFSAESQLLSTNGTSLSGGSAAGGSSGTTYIVTALYVRPGQVVARGEMLARATTVSDCAGDCFNVPATIEAPTAGVIESVSAEVGYSAPSGNQITMRIGALLTKVNISESLINGITVGQPATVTISALGATFTGKVSSIGFVATAASGGAQQYPVMVALDSIPASLREGMSASATISVASKESVLTIPIAALGGTDAARTVQVLAADGSVSSADVAVGLIGDTTVEITTGLSAGEKVVTGILGQLTTSSSAGGFGGGSGFGGGGGRRNPLP